MYLFHLEKPIRRSGRAYTAIIAAIHSRDTRMPEDWLCIDGVEMLIADDGSEYQMDEQHTPVIYVPQSNLIAIEYWHEAPEEE